MSHLFVYCCTFFPEAFQLLTFTTYFKFKVLVFQLIDQAARFVWSVKVKIKSFNWQLIKHSVMHKDLQHRIRNPFQLPFSSTWSQQETTFPFFSCQYPLEVSCCLKRFLLLCFWLIAFLVVGLPCVQGNVSDCWSPPPDLVSLTQGGRPHQKSFWWWHLGPATDILVFSDRPFSKWLKLVTNLFQISHSFGVSVVLVSVWCNLLTSSCAPWELVLSMW